MKKFIIIKLPKAHSTVDLITNSSSELFIIKGQDTQSVNNIVKNLIDRTNAYYGQDHGSWYDNHCSCIKGVVDFNDFNQYFDFEQLKVLIEQYEKEPWEFHEFDCVNTFDCMSWETFETFEAIHNHYFVDNNCKADYLYVMVEALLKMCVLKLCECEANDQYVVERLIGVLATKEFIFDWIKNMQRDLACRYIRVSLDNNIIDMHELSSHFDVIYHTSE